MTTAAPARSPLGAQFGLYLLVGGASSVVDLGGFAAFRALGLAVMAASAASFLCGTAFNYVASTTIAFRAGKHPRAEEVGRLLGVALVALGLNTGLVWVFVTTVGLDPLVAKAVAIPCLLGWNFLARRWLVFRPEIPDATRRIGRAVAERLGRG